MTRLLLSLGTILGLATTASADLILGFSPANASIQVGQTVNVDIILTLTDPVTPDSADIRTNGVDQADIQLSLDTTAATVTSLNFGPGFSDPFNLSDLSNTSSPFMSAAGASVTAPAGSPTSITIGTFVFTGQSVGTTIATTVNTGFTDFVFAIDPTPDADIDSQIFGLESATITVSAIPEPSSFLFLGLAGAVTASIRFGFMKRSFAGCCCL